MANQSPYGGFVDLTPYRQGLGGPAVNPLESLVQGFTQGQAIRNLPETLQTQRQMQLEQELTRRLNNAIMQQKLIDLQNPQAALAREVQKSLAISSANPASGVVAMPAGLEGEVIAQPGALTADQQLALEAGGAAPTVAPAGVPIRPVSLEGVPTGFGQDLTAAAAATEALSTAKGQSALERLILGNEARKAIAETGNASKERMATTGNQTKKDIAGMKGAAGSKPITETSKANILGRAGKSGLIVSDADLDKFRNDAGDIDYGKLAMASGRAERESIDNLNHEKLNKLPAEVKSKVASYQAVQKDLERLREKLNEEVASGDIPSGMQDVISGSLSESPTNFFTRTFQRFVLQPSQSKTAAENERLRGAVSASIGRAIAGAALTATEKQNLIPFSPQAGDSFERLLEKSAGLEQFLANQIEGLTTPIPSGGAPSIVPKTSTGPKIIKITPRAQ